MRVRTGRLVAVAVAAIVGATPIAATQQAQAASTTISWKGLTWSVFEGQGNHQGYYRPGNVGINADGDLTIKAIRHCTSGGITASTPIHVEPCANPDNTKYSIGRVQIPDHIQANRDFRITFRAKMPQPPAAAGARSALWMHNKSAYCGGGSSSALGEVDVLEWYSKAPSETTSTTHMGCTSSAGSKPVYNSEPYRGTTAFDSSAFNTFSAEKVGSTVRYFVNGTKVATHTCGVNPPTRAGSCTEIMTQSWMPIMQTEVFWDNGTDNRMDGPARGQNFSTQTLTVRDFRIDYLSAAPVPGASWALSNAFGGMGDHSFNFGNPGDIPVVGDWDGNGSFTPGVVRDAWWYLSNDFSGTTHIVTPYGNAGDIPVVGDWDGNGTSTPGIVRNAWFYLSNGFSGVTHVATPYGDGGDIPVVGDWDGNGTTTPGVHRGDWWYMSNDFSGGTHRAVNFGVGGDEGVVGDWDGNGTDTPGVHRGDWWYLSNDFSGSLSRAFQFGNPGDRALAGDWNGDRVWTPGIHR